ncbi:hypothetical protein [Pseudoalteromonas spongiae]|uniref:hypothetical protein n=1 Tax=Pseudoalteromonas spongiae TaxID=298657 RepID=UPI000C2D13CA|nr:hypothetical protein [Pseudoalteromonas spongiae]
MSNKILTPDGWVILKITTAKSTFYKVFASWQENDRWRLSSGSEAPPEISKCGKYWIWPQASGSCYHLLVNEENGYTYYTGNKLSEILACSNNKGGLIERVKLSSILNE